MPDSVSTTSRISLTVNGRQHELELDNRTTLLDALREHLDLTGAKKGCDHGQCGACTVLLDGRRANACLVLAVAAQSHAVTTIEGVAAGDGLHPLQQAFIEHGGFQCGFCTPGMILAAKALLDENPNPSEAELKHFMHGNICRCTGYKKIIESIMAAAKKMRVKA